jgi:hypothetical protein
MVSVYALLCVAALARSDCSPATAIDVVRMPDADNELVCLQGSMMTLARLAVQAGAGEYWKVVCTQRADRPNVAETQQPDLPTAMRGAHRDARTRTSTESTDRN